MGLRIVVIGLSITSSWGNGHATVYRGLMRELCRRGHHPLFLERDKPWYSDTRDKISRSWGEVSIYHSLDDLKRRFTQTIQTADCVIVGSYVPDGISIGTWVTAEASGLTAFYDIDTPVTQTLVNAGKCEYLSARLIPRYTVYLSFTGGRILERIEQTYGSTIVRPFYCCVDPHHYYPDNRLRRYDLGYLGTYCPDRQGSLERFLLRPAIARHQALFVVAGPMYPEQVTWPSNVEHVDHIPQQEHRAFYNSQRFTLNLTRGDMMRWGYSPSVRLFEAAACGVPIISDDWPGLVEFFMPGKEILVAHSPHDVIEYLGDLPAKDAQEIAQRARQRVLHQHTAAHRAAELEALIQNNGNLSTVPDQLPITYEM